MIGEPLWCVLRMAARTTLGVSESLGRSGFETWTPTAILLRQRASAIVEVPAPIMPTYAFAPSRHLFDLIALSACPGNEHGGFSVMRMPQGVPLIADRELTRLREQEASSRPRPKRRARVAEKYDIGETVRIPSGRHGGFEGLDGIVDESDPRHTMVCFGGFLRLKIETFILRADGVSEADQLAA